MIIAATVSLGWCLLALRLGPRIGFVDQPDVGVLKAHARPAVPLGGVGVFLAVHLAAVARDGLDVVLLGTSSIVLVLGLVDDHAGIRPVVRLAVEVVAAFLLVTAGAIGISDVWWTVVAAGLVVFSINAVNLLDGLDGLAGLAGVVSAVALAFIYEGRGLATAGAIELALALAAFLVLNWHPARVFLGDSGSYVTGLFLAYLILDSNGEGRLDVLVAAGVLGVFAIDLLASLIRRRSAGTPLFGGDRSHVYDQLRDRGHSIPSVAVLSGVTQGAIAVVVVGLDIVFSPMVGVITLTVVLTAILAWLGRAGFLTPRTG